MGKSLYWRSNLSTASNLGLLIIGFGIGCLLGVSVSPVVSIAITSLTGAAASIIAALSGLQEKQSNPKESDKYQISLSRWSVNPWPLAVLVIGIILGSIGGILARTHDILGANISAEITNEVQKWTIVGLNEEEIERRLFELEHPYTPYAEDLKWMKVDASSGVTTALVAEVEMWTQLGLEKEEAARRLFEIKYPLNRNLPISTSTTSKSGANSFDPNKTSLYLTPEDKQKCGDLLRYSYIADPDGVSEFREQVLESGVELFQKLAAVISDDEMFYKTLETLCEN